MTLNEINSALREIDSKISDDDFKTGQILLSAAEVGPDLERIIEFTGLDREFVQPRFERLVAEKIFSVSDGVIYANWADEENGGLSFILDIAVAQGLVTRAPSIK